MKWKRNRKRRVDGIKWMMRKVDSKRGRDGTGPHLLPCVRRQQVLMQLEQVVDVLVEPKEGGVSRRRFEVLHDAGRHLQESRFASEFCCFVCLCLG
jgi:hypothetical protein